MQGMITSEVASSVSSAFNDATVATVVISRRRHQVHRREPASGPASVSDPPLF